MSMSTFHYLALYAVSSALVMSRRWELPDEFLRRRLLPGHRGRGARLHARPGAGRNLEAGCSRATGGRRRTGESQPAGCLQAPAAIRSRGPVSGPADHAKAADAEPDLQGPAI